MGELQDLIEKLQGRPAPVDFADWRPGDQRYWASNTGLFGELTGWMPRVSAADGVRQLHGWIRDRQTRRFGGSP